MQWERFGVDFRKPIKVWSSSGQWQETKLICFIGDHAVVYIKKPIGKWYYETLDLTWYEEIASRKSYQLQNVKGKEEIGKWQQFKVKFASFVVSKV